jgi:hypothetical protein
MTERQEAEWLYAKGLELAILLKGTRNKNITEGSVNKFIDDEYDDIAGRIAGRILESAKKMISNNQLN